MNYASGSGKIKNFTYLSKQKKRKNKFAAFKKI
jgi:hypothetical protein